MYNSRCSGLCWDYQCWGSRRSPVVHWPTVTAGFDIWALHTHAAQCHVYTACTCAHAHTQVAKIVHRTLSHTGRLTRHILCCSGVCSAGLLRIWEYRCLDPSCPGVCQPLGTMLEGHSNSLHFDCPVLACQVLETAGLPRMNISLMHPMTAL